MQIQIQSFINSNIALYKVSDHCIRK